MTSLDHGGTTIHAAAYCLHDRAPEAPPCLHHRAPEAPPPRSCPTRQVQSQNMEQNTLLGRYPWSYPRHHRGRTYHVGFVLDRRHLATHFSDIFSSLRRLWCSN